MPPPDPPSDAELLHDVLDPVESFATFYRRHVDALLRFCAKKGADADTAADVASDTFLAALGHRASYDATYPDARLWLLQIASRKLIDGHRRTAGDRHRRDRLLATAPRPTDRDRDAYALLTADDGPALDVLSDLPPAQQAAIRQRVLDDRDYAEIARDLGISEQATRQQVSRGLARIRSLLGQER
ncbi:RNA polymerase sigma factor [Patulibacter minatonensis]|uniref:RNA polymerase sigma factor n=1 Tax=Patulibacter minatonensis TaxID=298163 RepID=UPI000686C828|nr:sigma-70 family RNA polymerase sigma factor [Patulibacter minatonensis]